MFYILTALYQEAEPFIEALQLKKFNQPSNFQIFQNNEYTLIISGVGGVNASIATTYLLTLFHPKKNDLFFNIGIAGGQKESLRLGELYLIHKIHDLCYNRDYYPDLIINHSLKEASLITVNRPLTNKGIITANNLLTNELDLHTVMSSEQDLIDMEASYVFSAAKYFLSPHQIVIMKIISDHLAPNSVSQEQVTRLVADNLANICRFCTKWKEILEEQLEVKLPIELISEVKKHLYLSVTQNIQLEQMLKSYLLQDKKKKEKSIEIKNILNEYLAKEVKSKQEGKRYFAELKRTLFPS